MKYLLQLSLFIFLFLFWIILSGKGDIFFIVSGAITSITIVIIATYINLLDEEGHPIKILPRIFFYWLWLLKEIVLSAIYLSKIIISPKLSISPQYVKIKSNQKSSLGFSIFANSITLTPGTITVIAKNSTKEIDVHAITQETAKSLKTGKMDTMVSWLMRNK
ncbi:MAG: Na+/H+ antiporter subunit E [Alphaproteobacteria bacterium]|jgi:multicomponent Na+:H+ antiporter subunit E|nr:Na+/H+ antiporter subunit E [Hyphomicrobiales bacterium]|tara:strand:+ start:65945 stop:66433 length:489 start_codon:yes stop_codon:yes gene_type:complete